MKFPAKKIITAVCLLCILVAVIAAASVLIPRAEFENNDRDVALIFDWAQISDMAQREGIGYDEVIHSFTDENGNLLINGILYKESTLSDLQNMGLVYQVNGVEFGQNIAAGLYKTESNTIDNSLNYIICFSQDTAEQVYMALDNKTNSKVVRLNLQNASGKDEFAIGTSMPLTELAALGMGFPSDILDVAQDNNLAIALQIRSFNVATKEAVDTAFDLPAGYNVIAIGFNDSDLPGANMNTSGWTAMQDLLVAKFNELQLPLIKAEFFTQKGFESFAQKLDYDIIRMHPITEKEVATLSDEQIAQRFALATSERNMRLALLRIPKNDISSNVTYVQTVRSAIEHKGLELTNTPSHLPACHVALWQVILLSLGIAGAGCLLCLLLGFKKWSYVFAVLGFVGAVGLLLIGHAAMAKKLLALLAAIIFPLLSIYTVLGEKPSKNIFTAALKLFLMSALTLVGAFIMAALLSDRAYMTSTLTFSGVKVAQLLPLLLLGYLYFMRTNGNRNLLLQAKEICGKPVNIGMTLVVFLGLAIAAVLVLRSGNDAVSVSSFERAFRAALDNYLLVRPRTKEFAFAHPLMLVMLYFGYKKYMLPLVLCAGIGQVSMVNTFSHLHTPLAASLLRTFNGLWLGILIGAVLIGVICLIRKGLKNGRLLSEK